MAIQAKSRRRLLLLLALVLTAGGVGAALFASRHDALDEEARLARTSGIQAYEDGDYTQAVRALGRFLRRLDPDPEALLRYAQAILRLPDVNEEYVHSAMASLRRCIKMEPDNRLARRTLLDLYVQQRAYSEAIVQTDWFLEREADHEHALLVKAELLARMRRFEDAQAVLEPHTSPGSPRLRQHLEYLTILSLLETDPAEIAARAREVQQQHASDPRFQLLTAHAQLLAGEREKARAALALLVPIARTDANFGRTLMPHLDAARMPVEALDTLSAIPASDLDTLVRVEIVRRHWELGRRDLVPELVATWKTEPETMATPVLGYQALALSRLGRREEAAPLVEVLAGRKKQKLARGWTQLLRTVMDEASTSVADRILACREAVDTDPLNALSRFELGRAYRAAGEDELAIREFAEAARLAPSWSEPASVGANLLVKNGRLAEAIHSARVADALQTKDPGVALLLALLKSADQPGRSLQERLLLALDAADMVPTSVLPMRVSLLASLGRTDDAKRLIREALAAEHSTPDTLLACAGLSRVANLGLDEACIERCEALFGQLPATALMRARRLADREGAGAGLSLLSAQRTASEKDAASWDVAEASFLDATGDSAGAEKAWRRAADSGAAKPRLLRSILDRSAPWGDRAFVRDLIGKLRVATHEACLWWRIHEARHLLEAGGSEADAEKAVETLEWVIKAAPEQPDARLLLARAHDRMGRVQEALDQLLVARRHLAESVALELQIAGLHQRLGKGLSARNVLTRLLQGGRARARDRVAIAAMFARLGDGAAVAELLDPMDEATDAPAVTQRRAELYAAVGAHRKADRLIRVVLGKDENPRALLLAAGLAEMLNDSSRTEQLLERVRATTPDALVRERSLAAHHKRMGRIGLAEIHERRVVAFDGAEREDWLLLLSSLVRQGKSEALSAVVAKGVENGALAAESPPLKEAVLRIAASHPSRVALGVAYVEASGERRGVAERGLELLATAEGGELPDELRKLAGANAGFFELQLAVAEALQSARMYEDALTIYRTLKLQRPSSPEPARLMAYCYRALDRPMLAARAAQEWRDRSRAGRALEADIFLTEQSQANEALTLMEPYVEPAIARGHTKVLVLYGEALLRLGDRSRVDAFRRRSLSAKPGALRAWVFLAGLAAPMGHAELARAWLENDVFSGNAVPGELSIELAAAWQAIGRAQQDEGTAKRVTRLLERAAAGEPSAGDWERIGTIYELAGDTRRAEAAYREAVKRDRTRLVALNNLAMILVNAGKAEEALPLATALVRMRPRSAEARDTLAAAHRRLGALTAALREFEHARDLEPTNARWAVRILEVVHAQGDPQEAQRLLDELEAIYPRSAMTLPIRKAWDKVAAAIAAAGD